MYRFFYFILLCLLHLEIMASDKIKLYKDNILNNIPNNWFISEIKNDVIPWGHYSSSSFKGIEITLVGQKKFYLNGKVKINGIALSLLKKL